MNFFCLNFFLLKAYSTRMQLSDGLQIKFKFLCQFRCIFTAATSKYAVICNKMEDILRILIIIGINHQQFPTGQARWFHMYVFHIYVSKKPKISFSEYKLSKGKTYKTLMITVKTSHITIQCRYITVYTSQQMSTQRAY